MKASELRQLIALLPETQPITEEYEPRPYEPRKVWYRSQREHLLGWLKQYGGPGAYNRKNPGQDARHFYTHFQCAPGLLWLAEALGESEPTLRTAVQAIQAAGPKGAAQCGAFRKVIPWERIEALIDQGDQRGGAQEVDALTAFVDSVRDAPFGQLLIKEAELWSRLGLKKGSAAERRAAVSTLAQQLTVTPHEAKQAIYLEWSAGKASQPPQKTVTKRPAKATKRKFVPPVQPLDLTAPTLRAVSIRQPYAELILRGEKVEEYRVWDTKPGPILLHASRTVTPEEEREARKAGIALESLPLGALVGIVDVTGMKGHNGRYAWQLAHPRRFEMPIPYQGAVGIMRVPMDKVREQLRNMGGEVE